MNSLIAGSDNFIRLQHAIDSARNQFIVAFSDIKQIAVIVWETH
jgi:hypothetical protein